MKMKLMMSATLLLLMSHELLAQNIFNQYTSTVLRPNDNNSDENSENGTSSETSTSNTTVTQTHATGALLDPGNTTVTPAPAPAAAATVAKFDPQKDSSQTCNEWKAKKSSAIMEPLMKNGENENLDGAGGSNKMHQCVLLSGNNMRHLYNNGHALEFSWKQYAQAQPACLNLYFDKLSPDDQKAYVDNCGGPDVKSSKKCNDVQSLAVQCDAAAFLISTYERDWKSKEDVKTDTVKGGNPEIKCTGSGIETLDYDGCVKFVKNGDAIDAVQGQVYQGQQLVFQSNLMDAQAKAAKSGDAVTAALTAQKDSLEAQKQMMVQRAAIDTGKLAALKSYYNNVPTIEELDDNCKSFTTQAANHFLDMNIDLQKNCSLAVNAQPGFAFLENQQAREKMKSKLIKVGLDVGMDGVQAYLADKQSNNINNAIAKVDSFKPTDFAGTAGNNLQVTFCQTHAGDPKCLTGGLERTFDAMGDNVVNFGEGGSGASFTNNNPYADSAAIAAAAAAAASNNSVGSIGSVVPTAGGTSGLADSAAAATVSKGNSPSGGGGGGSGGGSGGGGGGGGVPGAQPTGGVSAAIQGKTPSYGGGASGGLSMMGGNGISKAKSGSKDDGNPFGKLFNKDAKSNVMNFRDIASQKVGSKGDNLFEMISKRYTTVNTDKRLLEYEIAK